MGSEGVLATKTGKNLNDIEESEVSPAITRFRGRSVL